MAWTCSGSNNAELVDNMVKCGLIEDNRVAEAMKRVDRAHYVKIKGAAYQDSPQGIGFGATISAPHMHAAASSYLLQYLKPGSRVLDIGSGSGYLVAVFYHLAGPDSVVVGIDHIPELVSSSVDSLKRDGLSSAIEAQKIIVVDGDGRQGYPSLGPYDAIHIGAAASSLSALQAALLPQLAAPGRIFAPVGPDGGHQDIYVIDKDIQGNVTCRDVMGVRYVPLTDKEDQLAARLY